MDLPPVVSNLGEVLLGTDIDLERHAGLEASGTVQVAGCTAELLVGPTCGLSIALTACCEGSWTWIRGIHTNISFVMDVLCHPLTQKVFG